MVSIVEEIKKQEAIAEQSRLKIEKLKEKEARRIVRIADKAGFFEVAVSDDALSDIFAELVKSQKPPMPKLSSDQ